MTDEREYPEQIYKYSASAIAECETHKQAVDLLIDAAAMVISEGGGTVESAIERLKESAETFADAEILANQGGLMQ